MPQEITEIQVTDAVQAMDMAFPGSPTVRIDGEDVEPDLPKLGSDGLTCRTYIADGNRQGVPPHVWIREAIAKAHQSDAAFRS